MPKDNTDNLLPLQMRTALNQDARFKGLPESEMVAKLSTLSLAQIGKIKGCGVKLIAEYAVNTGRATDLLETGWNVPGVDLKELERQYNEQKLLAAYAPDSWNDLKNIRQLAALYVMRDHLTLDLIKSIGNSEYEGDSSRDSRQLASINESIVKLETHLEIDPATRNAKSQQATASDIIQDLVDTSAEYLADFGVVHNTENGPAGYTVWNFPSPRYMPRCRACGSQDFVFKSPWNEKDYSFAVATADQMEKYVYAADFVPDGAPEGIGVFDAPETLNVQYPKIVLDEVVDVG